MSEKRYLLTLDEIMDIQAMVFLGAVLRRKSLAESSPSDEWLEAHAHHERTCHNKVQQGGGLLCSECGAFTPSVRDLCGEMPIRACANCGAKVVEE